MKAAIYGRVSTDNQEREGTSLQTQLENCITHYQKIVVALNETIRLMAEIDAAIPDWPIE